MPEPDPKGIWLDDDYPSSVFYCTLFASNRRNREARAQAIGRRVQQNGWLCSWCNGPIPAFRRADARFCREACRKRAARLRRGPRTRGAR